MSEDKSLLEKTQHNFKSIILTMVFGFTGLSLYLGLVHFSALAFTVVDNARFFDPMDSVNSRNMKNRHHVFLNNKIEF